MTRFARAKGSKSSNEKKEEDPTSWLEMKKALISKKAVQPVESNHTKEVKKVDPPKQTEWASLGHDPPLLLQHHRDKEQRGMKKTLNKTVEKAKKRKKNLDLNAVGDDNKLEKKKKKQVSSETNTCHEVDKLLGKPNKISKKRKFSEVETGDVKEPSKKKGENSKLKEKKVEKGNDMKSKDEKKFKKNLGESKQSLSDKRNHFRNKDGDKKSDNGPNPNFKSNWTLFNERRKFGNKSFGPYVVDEIIVNGEKISIGKFQGFNVTLEEAERLKQLRVDLIKQGVPKSELENIIKSERRRAEKALSRLKKSVCFHCRGSGHLLSNCPELTQREDTSTGICYKCGSTEHSALECKVVKGTNYQFAECFICKEQGHIARQCPDNPRGLYPQGGACRECGDVTHLRKDCPQVMSKKSEEVITVGLRNDRNLECLEEEIVNKEKQKPKHEMRKKSAVKF